MDISIIIPTYKREKVLCETLDNVRQHCQKSMETFSTWNVEILVIDQTAEHDTQTKAFLNAFVHNTKGISVRILNIARANLPNARNVGINNAVGAILIFIDDDVELSPAFLEAHVKCYQNNQIDAVAGRVILKNYTDGNILLNNSGRLKDFLRKVLFSILNRRKAAIIHPSGFILTNFEGKGACETEAGRGCNMSFRKSVFEKIGMFDDNYEGNALREETDLYYRMKKKHLKVWYEYDAMLYHLMQNVGGTRAERNDKYWQTYFNNQVYFYKKNFNFKLRWIATILIFDVKSCQKAGMDVKAIMSRAEKNALERLK